MSLSSSDSVRDLDISQRGCLFPDEQPPAYIQKASARSARAPQQKMAENAKSVKFALPALPCRTKIVILTKLWPAIA